MEKHFSAALFLLWLTFAAARSAAQAPAPEFISPDIKTARILPQGADFGYPLARLGDPLVLSFDAMGNQHEQLAYSIQHCNSDFVPDDLDFSEFADGFNNRPLQDFEPSFNTLETFCHYEIAIPNRDVQPTISGNYMITVYDEDDPETPLLQKYFMLYDEDDRGKIAARVMQPFLPEFQMQCQQIEVLVDNSAMRIANPEKYLKVYAMQNGDLESRRKLEISGILNSEIQYRGNSGANIFMGLNEFEFLDAKDVHFRPLGVDLIIYQNGRYHYYLTPEPYLQAYQTRGDINGQYYVKNDRAINSSLESDYVDATFYLEYDRFSDYAIYLYGALTNWQCNEGSRLKWSQEKKAWEVTVTIKQGLHNFMFVIKDSSGQIVDFHKGSHFNTGNEYLVAVYTSLTRSRGDRLVMAKAIK